MSRSFTNSGLFEGQSKFVRKRIISRRKKGFLFWNFLCENCIWSRLKYYTWYIKSYVSSEQLFSHYW